MAGPLVADDAAPALGERVSNWFRRISWWNPAQDNVDQLIRMYGNGLYVSAVGLSASQGDAFDQIAARLRTELARPTTDFREIMALELQLNRLYPPEVKERSYWEYRERFEQVASPRELAAYLASNPPALTPGGVPIPAAVRDADNLVLLEHIHKSYLVTLLREQAVRDLKHWIQKGLRWNLAVFGLAVFFLSVFSDIADQVRFFLIGLILIYFIGRMGAAMSVVQRLQTAVRDTGQDAFFEVTALCTGRRGVSIAMLSGGIFALLLYVIFAAGLAKNLGMSGGIFPEVEASSPANDAPQNGTGTPQANATNAQATARSGASTGTSAPQPRAAPRRASASAFPKFVRDIGRHLGFDDYPDFFKMLLLAFLAGFAERLVPDAIDRMIQRKSAGDAASGQGSS